MFVVFILGGTVGVAIQLHHMQRSAAAHVRHRILHAGSLLHREPLHWRSAQINSAGSMSEGKEVLTIHISAPV